MGVRYQEVEQPPVVVSGSVGQAGYRLLQLSIALTIHLSTYQPEERQNFYNVTDHAEAVKAALYEALLGEE